MSEEPTTGVRKRQQITNTNKQMIIWVAGTAAIVTICIMVFINLWQRISYQTRVNSEWGATNKSLDDSIKNISDLRTNVTALSTNNNIKSIQKLADPNLEKWQVVFDVLPPSCDVMAVEYSFTNIIFEDSHLGAAIKDTSASLGGASDCAAMLLDSGAGGGGINPQPITMTVTFKLANATDQDIVKALLSMEYSLHPIVVRSIEIKSSEGTKSADITAEIYFVPMASWQPSEKTIPLDANASTSTGASTGTGTGTSSGVVTK